MRIAVAVALWFFCGLMGIYLAFSAARVRRETFDPVHVWLTILGPFGLLLACITKATDTERESPRLRP